MVPAFAEGDEYAAAVLAWIASGDFAPALEEFFGTGAGLSTPVATPADHRLGQVYQQFAEP